MQGKQPPKKGLLSPKRVMEIADSLDRESGLAGVGSPLSTLNKKSTPDDSAKAYQAAFARIDEAERNKKNASRYRSLAENAMKAIALKNKKK
jgi:hypothetical protein